MIMLRTPTIAELSGITGELSEWQRSDWRGFLHPGDLGWRSMIGAERLAADLRCWVTSGTIVAIGMFDGEDLFRMAMSPSARDDGALADRIADDLEDGGVLPEGAVTVEARGAHALQGRLRSRGWGDDEPWTPLQLDLRTPLPVSARRAALRTAEIGIDRAAEWVAVHWSAFRGTTPTAEELEGRVRRWITMATGPFATLAHHLIGYDEEDRAVSACTVWTAGEGRPGLIEPLAVHRDHHGRGYGAAMTVAGARVLQRHGASAATVVAENANAGALATYLSAGFTAGDPVADLVRSAG